jgi:hypothetical protein
MNDPLMDNLYVILKSLIEGMIASKDKRKGVMQIKLHYSVVSYFPCDQDGKVNVYTEQHGIYLKAIAELRANYVEIDKPI